MGGADQTLTWFSADDSSTDPLKTLMRIPAALPMVFAMSKNANYSHLTQPELHAGLPHGNVALLLGIPS